MVQLGVAIVGKQIDHHTSGPLTEVTFTEVGSDFVQVEISSGHVYIFRVLSPTISMSWRPSNRRPNG